MIRPSGPPVENATGPAAIDAALASMSQMALHSLHLPLHQHWECCLGLSHRLLRVQLCRMNRYLLLPHRVGRMRL